MLRWTIAVLLAERHAIPGHIAAVSRLVCDLNREESAPGLVPEASDGHPIPGNVGSDREGRLNRFHRPYHEALADWLAAADPALILSLHSFTPQLIRAVTAGKAEVEVPDTELAHYEETTAKPEEEEERAETTPPPDPDY